MVAQIFGNAVVQNIEEADLFERGAEFRRSLFGRSVFAREEWTQVKDRDVFVRRGDIALGARMCFARLASLFLPLLYA